MIVPSRLAALLAQLAVAVLALSACGSSPAPSPPPASDSGVHGVSMIRGGPALGNPRPEPGTRIAVYQGSLDGPLVARAKADADGRFSLALKPGRYTLVQMSDAARPKTVRVPPNGYVNVKLFIEAK